MRVIISIGHPAHVHYFKNAARILKDKGYKILFFVRERECIVDLVKKLGFDYVCYGKGGEGMLAKMIHIPITDYKLLKVSLKFKPDLFLSAGGIYAGQVAFLLRKPHISFTDTEHAKLGRLLNDSVSDIIFSPYVWNDNLHKRQVLLHSILEYFYLNKKYFTPDIKVKNTLSLNNNEKCCVVRFISWNANHDVGIKGLTYQNKIDLVTKIAEKYKVFISSEGELPKQLEQYRLLTHPSEFHSVMNYATLCISEGSTTASEAAILGTPTIYVNPLKVSNCDEEEKFELLYQNTDIDKVINKALEILETNDVKNIYQERRDKFTSQMIDANAFLVWFIENYPESKRIMKENPDYQYRFK